VLARHHVLGRAAEPADPAGARLGEQKGYKSIFFLGSDYVFPRTANLILKKHITHDGKTRRRRRVRAARRQRLQRRDQQDQGREADIIFSTLNGDSNVSFFKQMAAAGLPSAKLPVMSFSIAEQEAKAIGPVAARGQLRRVELLPDRCPIRSTRNSSPPIKRSIRARPSTIRWRTATSTSTRGPRP
jgi:ABC-type branched-subunit amino acid transport system substrate-binding protein